MTGWAGSGAAGPPLHTDDPVAVAPGHLELISSARGSERGSDAFVDVTALDVALGVLPGFEIDLTLDIALRDHEEDDDGQLEHSTTPLTLGFKWEALRTTDFSLALAPYAAFSVEDPDDVSVSLPVLTELHRGRVRAGVGGSYVLANRSPDGWELGAYGGFTAIPGVELLGELVASAFLDRADPQLFFNLGGDFALGDRLHLLASAGTGLYGGADSRREWGAYLGLQLLLGPLFGGSADGPTPGANANARRASPGGPALLELTNRQIRPRRLPDAAWR